VLQAIKEATNRAELLEMAIQHYCTTDKPRNVKLQVLTEAESYIEYVKDTTEMNRYDISEYKAINL
jgi:hypothetical protein